MRIIKLAVRIVLEQRRSLIATAAALLLVAALATAGGSVIATLGEATARHYRIDVMGEIAGRVAPSLLEEVRSRSDGRAALSATVREAGAIAVADQLLTVTLAWTDLGAELEYRGLPLPEDIRRFDSVALGGTPAVEDLSGRVVRAVSGDGTSRLIRVRQVYQHGERSATLLVHDPGTLDERTVGVRMHGGARRVRAANELTDGLPLVRTDWRSRAAAELGPLRNRFAFLIASLIVIAGAVLLPAQLILARRTTDVHALLIAWGFPERRRAALVYLIGAALGLFSSAVGGLIGLLTVSVLNAGTVPAAGLLPFGWSQEFDLLLAALVTPSMGWFLGTVVISTLLGVATAFPTVSFVGTLVSRRGLWN